MINFFRKIRKKLADDNKPLKYMRYAIGEIVLVVIGILIALSLNNLNESQKQEILEIQYLDRLVSDLANDINYYDKRIAFAAEASENFNFFIHEIYESQKNIKGVRKLFGYLSLNTDHLISDNATYRELYSTGNLNIFKNQEIRKSITNHYRLNEEVAENIKEFNNFSTKYLFEANQDVKNFYKFIDLKKQVANGVSTPYDNPIMFLKGEWNFINDPNSEKFQALELMAWMYWYRHQEHMGFFKTLKLNTEELISKINNELENNAN